MAIPVLAGLDDVMGRAANTLPSQFRHVRTPAATLPEFLRPHADWAGHVALANRYRRVRVNAEFRIALNPWLARLIDRHRCSDAGNERITCAALLYRLAYHDSHCRLLATLRPAFLPPYTRCHLDG